MLAAGTSSYQIAAKFRCSQVTARNLKERGFQKPKPAERVLRKEDIEAMAGAG
jgi:hypothetical protein